MPRDAVHGQRAGRSTGGPWAVLRSAKARHRKVSNAMLNAVVSSPGEGLPQSVAADATGGRAIPAGACQRLPTLQRNALRKLFDRPNFTPEEVAALGYRRLQQAEGVGQKGLDTILAWLRDYGFDLQPPQPRPAAPKESGAASRRSLEGAMRLLRINGYGVHRLDGGTDTD